jgi:hypothetical protein
MTATDYANTANDTEAIPSIGKFDQAQHYLLLPVLPERKFN